MVLKHNSISLCISVRVRFVCFCKSSMSLFNLIITTTASSNWTDGYKFTTSKEVCTSLGHIFHSFASSTIVDEFKTLCLFLFQVDCIILTKYFEVRIELWIFVQHYVKFCLQKITRTSCELLIHQKTLNTIKVKVIWKKSFNNWKMKTRNIHR